MKSYFFYTDQLTVGYDGKPLIKEINIQLNKGEILTLIGPNGAGKSTILKSITRQLSLIGGTVSGTGTDEPHDEQRGFQETGRSAHRAYASGTYDL